VDSGYVRRMVNLTALAPDIVAAILDEGGAAAGGDAIRAGGGSAGAVGGAAGANWDGALANAALRS